MMMMGMMMLSEVEWMHDDAIFVRWGRQRGRGGGGWGGLVMANETKIICNKSVC